MRLQLDSFKSLAAAGWTGVAARRCDTCKTHPAAAFCLVESAFLCLNCDSKIHGANKLLSRHERVWMCEVCEQAPAVVTCKADAAALCVTCDADTHSANPLASRHERVPVEPFFNSADESLVKSSQFNFLVPNDYHNGRCGDAGFHHQQEDVVDEVSWLLPNLPNINSKLVGLEENPEMKSGDLFLSEMDPFLDMDFHHQSHRYSAGSDSVVPVQTNNKPTPVPIINNEICYDVDFCRSKLSSFNYPSQSLSHSVSSSSLDVGVVPDGNSLSDVSYPFGRNLNTSFDPNGPISGTATINQANQICGIDREARVLRYREKRKNRKFEKTIRYASRKAYAETRPRIKGRFAKRTELDSDVDHLFNSPPSVGFMSNAQYGVVPSF